ALPSARHLADQIGLALEEVGVRRRRPVEAGAGELRERAVRSLPCLVEPPARLEDGGTGTQGVPAGHWPAHAGHDRLERRPLDRERGLGLLTLRRAGCGEVDELADLGMKAGP